MQRLLGQWDGQKMLSNKCAKRLNVHNEETAMAERKWCVRCSREGHRSHACTQPIMLFTSLLTNEET